MLYSIYRSLTLISTKCSSDKRKLFYTFTVKVSHQPLTYNVHKTGKHSTPKCWYTVFVRFSFEMFIKKVSINIFVEVRDRHNWGLFLVPDFLNTKPKRKLLFFCLLKYYLILLKYYNKIIQD